MTWETIRPLAGQSALRVRRRTVLAGTLAISLALGVAGATAGPTWAVSDGPAAVPAAAESSQPTFDYPYLTGVSGADPAASVNLAGTWDFTPLTNTVCTGGGRFGATTGPFLECVDTELSGEQTTIQVPGGGWLKQGWDDLSRAVYSRTIEVPEVADGQVTKLDLGAVNHRATALVNGEEVGSQTTAYTSSVFDLSDVVEPGGTYELEVLVEGRKAFVGEDGRYLVPEGASWSDDVAQGIFRAATLEVYPAVYVSDTFVQTSVVDESLTYDVYVTNSTDSPQNVEIAGALSSWNEEDWAYPAIPELEQVVPAGTTEKITVGPLDWTPGEASYWLPNVPYQADYLAQLHNLGVSIAVDGGDETSSFDVRFGFRELRQVGADYELNGVRVNFRGDSLQGANFDNIDFHGVSDAFDTLPGFLAPSEGNGGWPQAVRNYQRLNFNIVRIHQIPASSYMLDVADELGLMIQDETAIRGSNDRQNFEVGGGRDYMVKHLSDLVLRDRNHASVLRWSQANEPEMDIFDLVGVKNANPGAGPELDEVLYQTVMALDTTRPISTDGDSADLPHDNYAVFCHYVGTNGEFLQIGQYTENICDDGSPKPHGQGEFIWNNDYTPQGLTWFATASMRMREQGADDTRPYTLLSAWSSVIPGVDRTDMKLERGYPDGPNPLYGEDNLADPWANDQIELLQKAYHPTAAIDSAFWNENKLSNEAGEWPIAPSSIDPGPNTRTLTVFNDALSGDDVTVEWSVRGGSAEGAAVASGTIDAQIALGTSEQIEIAFDAPSTQTLLYLDLRVEKPDGTTFSDASTVYAVRTTSPMFSDVPEGVQFYDEIQWLGRAGISTGWVQADGTRQYRPLNSIARDAMAAFLYRLAGSPDVELPAASPFTDVAPDNQFYEEIVWLSQEGISTGWDNGDGTFSFRPLDPIARDAMAAFLYRSADSPSFEVPTSSPFQDVSTSDQFYKEIAWMRATGVATGWQGNDGRDYYRSLAPVARDAMAAFLNRYHQLD